jgi:hypothetical protein
MAAVKSPPWKAKTALFVALMATAIALGPALAHLFELPNKINLQRADYFTVQQIYAGWSLLGGLLAVQFVAIVSVVLLAGDDRLLRTLALAALACLVGAQVLFWTLTYPANTATANWTVQPDDWQALRLQWEYSHAAGALLQLAATACLGFAAVRDRRQPR